MRLWWLVSRKELRDLSRDRRSLINIFLFSAFFGPIMAMAMMSFSIRMGIDDAERPLDVPAMGSQYAPQLVSFLKTRNIELIPVDGDSESGIPDQEAPLSVRFTEQFAQAYATGAPAYIDVYADESRTATPRQLWRLRSALEEWRAHIAMGRLLLQGVDPRLPVVAELRVFDTYPGTSPLEIQLLQILPYFLILGVIQAAMLVASDITAGERERQTLEPLLLNPIPVTDILMGKILVTVIVCTLVVTMSCIAFWGGSHLLPVEDIGLKIRYSLFVTTALLLMPLTFFVAPLMIFLGSFAKTVKEAQTWLSLTILAALVPSALQLVLQIEVAGWQLVIPVWSQQYLINEALKGVAISPFSWALSALGASALGGLFMWLAVRQYHDVMGR
jgi:sodium transport system permease protein